MQGEPLRSSRDVSERLRQRRSSGGERGLQNPEETSNQRVGRDAEGAARANLRSPGTAQTEAAQRHALLGAAPAAAPDPAGCALLLLLPSEAAAPRGVGPLLGRAARLKMARGAAAASLSLIHI